MTGAVEQLETRWRKLVYAGEAGWLLYLVVMLCVAFVVEIFPLRNDYMTNLVEVPASLAAGLGQLGMDIDTRARPDMAQTYMPWVGYSVFQAGLSLTAFIALLQRRWYLLGSCIALMIVPATPFGAAGGMRGSLTMIAVVAIGQAVVTRKMRHALWVLAATGGVWLATFAISPQGPHYTMRVHRDSDAGELRRLADVDVWLSSLPEQNRTEANYVRAQIAYIHHDWRALRAIAAIDASALQSTPFKGARLRVINRAVDASAPSPRPDSWLARNAVALRLFQESIFVTVLGLTILSALMRRRLKRIDKIATALNGLHPQRSMA